MTLEELRDRLAADRVNKNEQAIVMIEACLDTGIRQGNEIRTKLIKLGFNGRSIGIQLRTNAGLDPERHRWFKDENGDYRLHTGSTEDN